MLQITQPNCKLQKVVPNFSSNDAYNFEVQTSQTTAYFQVKTIIITGLSGSSFESPIQQTLNCTFSGATVYRLYKIKSSAMQGFDRMLKHLFTSFTISLKLTLSLSLARVGNHCKCTLKEILEQHTLLSHTHCNSAN